MATIIRVYNDAERQPIRATEFTIWGPRGYVFGPESSQVQQYNNGPYWKTVEGPHQTTRQDVAHYLRDCRAKEPGWRIEVIRHAFGRGRA